MCPSLCVLCLYSLWLLTIHPSIYQFIHPSINSFIHLSIHSSIHSSIYQFIHPLIDQDNTQEVVRIMATKSFAIVVTASGKVKNYPFNPYVYWFTSHPLYHTYMSIDVPVIHYIIHIYPLIYQSSIISCTMTSMNWPIRLL